jgi:SAM-dependent MidA family methyltransferase
MVPAGIAAEMVEQGGRVTFARFMELALTHPTDGYYSRTETLLGPRGHFSTAPRLSRAFNGAVGRLLEELIDAALLAGAPAARPAGSPGVRPGVTLIELGAGEADLAEALLERWQPDRPDLRERLTYTIVEVGEELRAQQRRILAGAMDRGWRIVWAETVAEALAGAGATVVVGNEFFDALPVHVIDVGGAAPTEAWVELEAAVAEASAGPGGQTTAAAGRPVREVWGALSGEAETELRHVFGTADANSLRALTRDGIIELRPSAGELVGRLAAGPTAVCLLTIDYGEWFAGSGCAQPASSPSLPPNRGSLRGYFRHRMVRDLYLRVGRQDLTADVDFRALDLHGRSAGFETVLFSTVADLLLADGGRERLESLRRVAGAMATGASAACGSLPAAPDDGASPRALDADREATVLEGLLDAQGLGGAFKVMLQVRG